MPTLRDQHFTRLNSYRRSREYVEYARTAIQMSDESIREHVGGDLADLPSLFGVRWAIDERIYNEFLEMLPPMRWTGGGSYQSFLMRELTFGTITSKFTREGDRYWCEFVDARVRLDARVRS